MIWKRKNIIVPVNKLIERPKALGKRKMIALKCFSAGRKSIKFSEISSLEPQCKSAMAAPAK